MNSTREFTHRITPSPATLLIAAVLLFATLPSFAAKIEKHSLEFRGKTRAYYLYVPDGLRAASPAPLVIVLHGSNRNGSSLVERWKRLAQEQGIIVAGPDSINPAEWGAPLDGPTFLREVADAVSAAWPVDRRRMYLFGHSAGAGFALQIGLVESEYFAAVAVHAGALDTDRYGLTELATRKIPFTLFIGTKDERVPLDSVRATRDALQKAGFVADLTEMTGHTHDYYGKAEVINGAAWEFLSKYSLSADPKFTQYQNM
ncbi:MAG: PHB depolymerase family esterase [Acidobacteriota bacterium]